MEANEFKNPLSFDKITDLFFAILNVMIIVATPVVVGMLIYAGFLYVTARGNPEQIRKASRALTYGVIGGVIIIGSVAILQIVKNVAESF